MDINTSIRKLTTLLIVLFIALSGGLVYWQTVVAAQVTANIHNDRHCLLDNAPVRGRIFDRNGVLLAESVADPHARCGYTRHYTDPSLAAFIGYYVQGYPATGLEAQYDDYLSGRIGMTALDNTINQTLHHPPIGDDLYLTIDDRIQKVVDQHFDDHPTIDNRVSFVTDRGSVVVTNPHTGEILAMLSRPGFDPNKLVQTLQNGDLSYYTQLDKDPKQPLLPRPIRGLYPPGSTYKTVTLLAALDSHHTTLDQKFDRQHAIGPINYNGQNIGPEGNNLSSQAQFPVTTDYGFTHSDNVIFAQLGVNTGFDTWMQYNHSFYVERQIPFDLPVLASHVLPPGRTQMADNELAADAYGQGFDVVTPLQMSLVDDVVANNGQLMRPFLVTKISDHNNNPILTFNPQSLGTVVSSQTATDVRHAMFDVIRCGSGSYVENLLTSHLGVIGKTGTAQVSSTVNINPHGWLITQAPYSTANPDQLPALTIVGVKENGGEGGFVTSPMLNHIYSDVFSKGYVTAQLPPGPDPNYCQQNHLIP